MPVEKTKPMWHVEHPGAKKIFMTLWGIFLAYGVVYLGSQIRNSLAMYPYIGRSLRPEHVITVDADGKVTAIPDIAVVSMGVDLRGTTVAEVQDKSTATMNNLIAQLNALGIDKKDIQTTNYNIYPRVKYIDKQGDVPDGFEVNETVTVKVRDLTKSNQVVALAGTVGANMVNGLQFTFDDPDVYKEQARDLALAKAKDKAARLAGQLGVQLVSVVAFSEDQGGTGGPIFYAKDVSMGAGGAAPAPMIETGSNDVTTHVTVTYEIR